MAPSASRESSSPLRDDRTTAANPSPEGEIRREFQEFREAAVRLAERVRDLSIDDTDPVTAARADLHLVRSIFGKWSSDVLVALHSLPTAGFEELRRSLTGISPRVLSLKLKELEQNGMLQREILDTRPPRVRYSLTERGWTVAWLAQPVLLYLRFTDGPPANAAGERGALATPPVRRAVFAPSTDADLERSEMPEPRTAQAAPRGDRSSAPRSRMETVAP